MLILAGDLHIHIIYWPNIIRQQPAVAYSPSIIIRPPYKQAYSPNRLV